MIPVLAGWMACQPTVADSAVDTEVVDTDVDTDTDTDPDTEIPDGLNGSKPAENLPAPEFAATNRDGTPRARPDLIGHPTVVWFYPAAMTSG